MKQRLCWLGLLLVLGSVATAAVAAEAWGPSVDGLQMSIALRQESTPEAPAFAITIRNGAAGSVRLNLGLQIPTAQSPVHIGLSILDAHGKAHDFWFVDRRYAGIAGGSSSFVIRLRPGESHTFALGLDDFWLRDMTADATSLRGTLQLSAHFKSSAPFSASIDQRAQPLVWLGELRSNTLQLER